MHLKQTPVWLKQPPFNFKFQCKMRFVLPANHTLLHRFPPSSKTSSIILLFPQAYHYKILLEWNFNPSLTRSFIFGSRENCEEDKNKLLGVLFLCLTCNLLGRCKCQNLNKCSPRRHFTTFTTPKTINYCFISRFMTEEILSIECKWSKRTLAKRDEERRSRKLVFWICRVTWKFIRLFIFLCSFIDWKWVERVINATGF